MDSHGHSRSLRNKMTLPEILLWSRLQRRQTGHLINRQYEIGSYTVDFFCRKLNVAIEVDGKIHELKRGKDESRDLWLSNEGVRILRIPARRILKDPDFAAQQVKEFLDQVQFEQNLDASVD